MMKKFSWTYKIGLILGVLIVVWIAAALLLNTASAEGLPLSLRLSSRLSADYRVDKVGPLKALSLSIIGDMLRDMGMGAQEAEEHEASMKALMEDPVPTATARDFEGAAPFTATPTHTSTPTHTRTPTATRTTIPTKPPTSTQTATPRKVSTAVPIGDGQDPKIKDSGTISPSIGPASCTVNVSVANVIVQDPGPSSGIAWTKLKYKIYNEDFSAHFNSYVFSSPLSACWTNPLPGGGVETCFSGPSPAFQIQIFPGFAGPSDYTGSQFNVKVWVLTHDNVGREDYFEYGAYSIPASCDDPPPTNTPVPPTNTPIPPTATP